ncbi:hypothetical protein [Aureimonas sp. AU22]|uniref:hypothetical protein n=1 Tax=Aureimonas sp. AU22 TaxID=1638162 RepID=UPI00178CB3EF|nr:hypothetical protein [Aureimonas sp. AU22]
MALGFCAAVVAAAPGCAPVEAPAAERTDPALDLLTTYRAQMEAFNNTPTGISDEDLNALRDQTWGPFFEEINAEPHKMPACTSLAGVAMVLRVVLAEQNLYDFDEALVRSALAFFDARPA